MHSDVPEASGELYRLLVESSLAGQCVLRDDRFVYVNARFAEIFGYTREEIVSSCRVVDLVAEGDRERFLEQMRTRLAGDRSVAPQSYRGLRKDGSIVLADVTGAAVQIGGRPAILGTLLDATERQSLEEQLRLAQRMESVGRLAGGIAHDFNNLLAVIGGYTELLLSQENEGTEARESLLEIQKAAERAATLTRQLLAFSRQQVLQPSVVDLNAAIAGLGRMLQRLIGEDIAIRTELAPDLGRVCIDPGQLEQVVLNVAVNARDAMPKGGVLTLATRNVELAGVGPDGPVRFVSGPYVQLDVADSGAGMDEQTRSHAFEPFFTTKERGRGTGLGLSTVYGIVKQSGGYIWAKSEPGRGTTITIQLPRVSEELTPESLGQPHEVAAGTETVLLAEDEDAVRALARELLERNGYRVLAAESGERALDVNASHEGPIHLLLTDVVMTGMSGVDLATRLKAARPGVRVLYMSGYASEAVPNGILDRNQPFLQKPFTLRSLLDKVRLVLDAST